MADDPVGRQLLTELSHAIKAGDAPGVAAILDQRPELLNVVLPCTCSRRGHTPLVMAAHMEKRDALLLLLERGADLRGSVWAAQIPCRLSGLSRKNEDMIVLLLEAGADARLVIRDAAASHQWGLIKRLARAGYTQTVNNQDHNGSTALHMACRLHAAPQRVCALLLAGADPKIVNHDGKTPRDFATRDVAAVLDEWDRELLRGYLIYRARKVREDQVRVGPVFAAIRDIAPPMAALALALPPHLRPRIRVYHPSVEILASGGRQGFEEGQAAGWEDREEVGEEERHATLKYVVENLPSELFIELAAGFHIQ